MKTTYFASICLILNSSLTLLSCQEEPAHGHMNAQHVYDVNNFDQVVAGGALEISIQQGDNHLIKATGYREDLDDLIVENKGTTLFIEFRNTRIHSFPTQITIVMPVVRGVNFSGTVTGTVNGFTRQSTRLDLLLSGASYLQAQVFSDEVHATMTGASRMILKGHGKTLEANIRGASDITSTDFSIESMHATVSGASRAKLNASKELRVNSMDASNVVYHEGPVLIAEMDGASIISIE